MQTGVIQIIGGAWRGRKLRFPALISLRPTLGRMRETVFNWLMPYIRGARCLDLFAGSGALGLEALSRGADFVDFCDQEPQLIAYLRKQLEHLQALSRAQVHCLKIPTSKSLFNQPFDIVFLDPPFHQNLLQKSCNWLEDNALLKSGTLIYLESEVCFEPSVPQDWQLLKITKTSCSRHCLFQKT